MPIKLSRISSAERKRLVEINNNKVVSIKTKCRSQRPFDETNLLEQRSSSSSSWTSRRQPITRIESTSYNNNKMSNKFILYLLLMLFCFLIVFVNKHKAEEDDEENIHHNNNSRSLGSHNKLWLFDDEETGHLGEGAGSKNKNYIYLINSSDNKKTNLTVDNSCLDKKEETGGEFNFNCTKSLDRHSVISRKDNNEDHDTSASILKLSHHQAPAASQQTTSNQQKQEQKAESQVKIYNSQQQFEGKANKVSKSSENNERANNNNDSNFYKKNKFNKLFNRGLSSGNSSSASSTKKIISLSSLLPKSKRQDLPQISTNSIISNEAELNPFKSASPFLSRTPSAPLPPFGAPQPPPPPSPDHMFYNLNQQHQAEAFSSLNHPLYMHHHHTGPRLPHVMGLSGAGLNNPIDPLFVDQTVAQSVENDQRIHLNKHQNEPTLYFASTTNGRDSNQARGNHQSMLAHLQQQQQHHHQKHQNSLIGSTTAANLLGDNRAKDLIGFINLNNAQQQQLLSAANHPTPNHRTTTSASNLNGLASMIKSAAEAWASSSSGSNGGGGGVGSIPDPSTPTIIVEHDGPSITTVDFGQPQPLRNVVAEEEPEEPEEGDAFYTQEVEQTESEGSNNDKRIAKLAKLNHNHHHHHHHHPTMRGFGEQQVNSQNIQTDTNNPRAYQNQNQLNDMFYEHDSANEDAIQDYLNLNNEKDHEHDNNNPHYHNNLQQSLSNYPDSINAAIRQQHRNNNEQQATRKANRNNKSIRNNDKDQLERLIRELQGISKAKRGGSSSDSSEVAKRIKDFLDGDNDNNNSSLDGLSSDDSSDGDNSNSDDQLDEQTAKLRKKLIAKLRSKAEARKKQISSNNNDGGGGGSSSSSSLFQSGEVKIPLHALLLAALDRRMSPSEKNSQTVSLSDNDNFIVDDRSKAIIGQAQQDFNSISSNLGSLMESNEATSGLRSGSNLYDSMLSQAANGGDSNGTTTSTSSAATNIPLDIGLPDNYNSSAAIANPVQPSMFILNNFGGAGSQPPTQPTNQSNSSTSSSSSSVTQEDDDKNEIDNNSDRRERKVERDETSATVTGRQKGEPEEEEQQQTDATTRMPTRRNRRRIRRFRKGRRDLNSNDEGDFDVIRQVDDFARDGDEENVLEPAWINNNNNSRKGRRFNKSRRRDSVEFDDEESENSNRQQRRVLSRRRPPPKLDEATYERNGERFIDKIHRETDNTDADIESNSSGIEDSIQPGAQEASRNNEIRYHRRRGAKDDEQDGDSADQADETTSSEEDPEEEEQRERMMKRARNNRVAEESTNVGSKFNPQMIDDEVNRIERIADEKRENNNNNNKRKRLMPNRDDGDEEDGNGEQQFPDRDGMESRNQLSTMRPGQVLKVTIGSNGNGIDTISAAGSSIILENNGTKVELGES